MKTSPRWPETIGVLRIVHKLDPILQVRQTTSDERLVGRLRLQNKRSDICSEAIANTFYDCALDV